MSLLGRGPGSLSEITLQGDTLVPQTFATPTNLAVNFDPAKLSRSIFSPGAGQSVFIRNMYYQTCDREVTIQRLSDETTAAELIRTVAPLATRAATVETLSWDGRRDDGSLAPPGLYAVHVRCQRPDRLVRSADATTWVTVQ
jgi:hypothetical protein